MYEYGIIFHDRRGHERLTIECQYPIDENSKDPTRIGRDKEMVISHVRADNAREAIREFWEIYDRTNSAKLQ